MFTSALLHELLAMYPAFLAVGDCGRLIVTLAVFPLAHIATGAFADTYAHSFLLSFSAVHTLITEEWWKHGFFISLYYS